MGRDIADAITLGILDKDLKELYEIIDMGKSKVINNTTIINDLIFDLCTNSNEEDGLCFSEEMFNVINKLKKFNYEKIYLSSKLTEATPYFELVINNIYDLLKSTYSNREYGMKICKELVLNFEDWLKNYTYMQRNENNKNEAVFDLNSEKDYCRAIIYYISGMTDNYAIDMYNKIIEF